MTSAQKALREILDNDYAVRSGVYSLVESSVRMEMDSRGEYRPVFDKELDDEAYRRLLQVDMMSDVSPSETELADDLFAKTKGVKSDPVIGYYTDLYAGHVVSGGYRERGSSGGMCSWLLAELLEKNIVDGVIHMHPVDPRKQDGKLFKYAISRSIDKVHQGAKSRYYPGELSKVLQEVKKKPGRYAIVGIPEFITEVRLLARVDPIIAERIKITVGLVCGHQKTAKYVEALAWQSGIRPGDLNSVDFRVKQSGSTAINYLHQFTGKIDGEEVTLSKTHAELFGEVWAYGFFKSKFSDFTDNVFNETADVVLGDAWLPEYNKDGMGNNIVIVRDPTIAKIIRDGIKSRVLKLDTVDAETIKRSQRGLIHHGQDEISYRLDQQRKKRRWTPSKRFSGSELPLIRQHIQDVRYAMALSSHDYYQEALALGDWSYFRDKMKPMIARYKFLYALKSGRLANNRNKSVAVDVEYIVDRLKIAMRLRTRLRGLKQKVRIRTRIRAFIKSVEDRREAKLRNLMVNHPHGATLTLTDYFNYGNMLQRYALQRFLLKKGYRFVSYAQESFDTRNKSFDRLRKTIPFVEKRIYRKPPNKNDNYGAYIVGSDQVWRKWGGSSGDDPLASVRYYFFDFVKNNSAKRIAYAASFGQSDIKEARLTEDFMKSVKPLVKKMTAVSLRERRGIEIAKEWWNTDAQLTIDPTMLLTARDYNRLVKRSTCDLVLSKPLFAYILASSEERNEHIRKLFSVYGNKPSDVLYLKEAKILPPVEQWLQNIRDAELVITDSFHGMVFSIMYNTPFVVLENIFGGNSRVESLLGDLGLEDRLLSDTQISNYSKISMKDIDWRNVNEKIDQLRRHSATWLLDALRDVAQ